MSARTVLVALAMWLVAGAGFSQIPRDIMDRTPAQLKAGIEKQHPVAFYILAQKLMEAGQQDEAVFWFYAGQLRARFHMVSNPDLSPSGEPAFFASLQFALRPVRPRR